MYIRILSQLLSSVLGLLGDQASVFMIPTVHLLATVINTYLSRNHISWPAFTTVLEGFLYMQKKMYQEAEKCFQSALLQYEESIGQQHLLTIEAQLYYAFCKQFTDILRALKVLECAQTELDTMLYSNHFLSAKVSYLRALLYQQCGKEQQALEHIMDTQRKIHGYSDELHPWVADLLYRIEANVGSGQKTHPQSGGYKDMYNQLIHRETADSQVFAVETEIEPFITQWRERADKNK